MGLFRPQLLELILSVKAWKPDRCCNSLKRQLLAELGLSRFAHSHSSHNSKKPQSILHHCRIETAP